MGKPAQHLQRLAVLAMGKFYAVIEASVDFGFWWLPIPATFDHSIYRVAPDTPCNRWLSHLLRTPRCVPADKPIASRSRAP